VAAAKQTSQFALDQANGLLRQMAFQVSRCIKSRDPETVHDLRVAIRRFTQALVVFKPCFPAKEVKKIRRRLGKIMALAGAVRNCDIGLKLLSKSRSAAAATLRSRIQAQRKDAERELTRLLRSWVDRKWYSKWRGRLAEDVAGKTFFGNPIEMTAQRMLPRMAKEFFRGGDQVAVPGVSPEKLHQFRIDSKRFRYTLELFIPLYGPTLQAWLDQIKAVQAVLGDFNDCETVRAMIANWDGHKAADRQLKRRQRRKMEEFAQHWCEKLADPGDVRRWTEYLSHFAGRRRVPKKPPARVLAAASGNTQESTILALAAGGSFR